MKNIFLHRISILVLLFAISQSVLGAQTTFDRICKGAHARRPQEKKDCNSCYVLTEKDFRSRSKVRNTVVISKPGKYCLGENIYFEPTKPATAIIIDADNVKLDLCSNTLTLANGQPAVTAIEIVAGHKSITVQNGTVSGFRNAIYGFIPAAGPGEEQLTLHDITLANLNLSDNGIDDDSAACGTAIFLSDNYALDPFPNPPSEFYIFDVAIKNVDANNNLGRCAVQITGADNLVFEDVHTNNTVYSFSASVGGYSISYSRNINMSNCQGNGTQHLDPEAIFSQVAGIFIDTSLNLYLRDCQFNNTFGLTNLVVNGANLTENQNAIYENCQFNNIVGGNGDGEFGALVINCVHDSDGGPFAYNSNGIKYINCQFNGAQRIGTAQSILPIGQSVVGARIQSTANLLFEDCQSAHISTETPGYTVNGFFVFSDSRQPIPPFGDVTSVEIRNCIATGFSGPAGVAGFRTGVTVRSSSKEAIANNFVYENCIAERMLSTSTQDSVAGIEHGFLFTAVGVQPIAVDNLLIRNCRVSEVKGGLDDLSAGILVRSTERPTIFSNSVSDCVNGIFLTGSNDFGFSKNGIMQNNTVDNCSISGYRDVLEPTASAWVDNMAFNNGTPASAAANYTITWAGVPPVSAGDLANYPIGCEKAYNISLIP
jgi:parallel beta-helix repeat protein